MQGTKKPPTSEVIEASKPDWRGERNTAPAAAMPRRDDRAEPDDDASASRIDVVNVDPARGDSAATGMVTLRRELAKLHQQAAAVEKSLEEQRRDRSDSLDRLERATERALQLEARLSAAEAEAVSLRKMQEASLAELLAVRAERDDLALAVETAKASTAELGKLKDEVVQLRARAEAATREGGELFKAKQEAANALAEAKQAKIETEKARKALDLAEEDAAMVGDQASKIREEATKIRVEADEARKELAKAHDEAAKARDEAAKARDEAAKAHDEAAKAHDEATKASLAELTKAREEAAKAHDEAATASLAELTKAREETAAATAELEKLREDLGRAKDDNSRDRATARDRIDLLERALDDARAATARTERELEAARNNEERLGRQLEASQAAAGKAESRATSTQMSHAALEHSVRRLREEVAGAFARVVQNSPPPLPDTSIVSIPPEMIESLPPDAPDGDFSAHDSAVPSSPASKSVPPPAPASVAPASVAPASVAPASVAPSVAPAPVASTSASPASIAPRPVSAAPSPLATIASIPPPTYASVPPQVHESTSPNGGNRTMPPPKEHSIPPAAKASEPPPGSAPVSMPPAEGWSDSSPPTRRPWSAMPPPYTETLDLASKTRQELLAKLVDPDHATAACVELRLHPEWLRSVPPPTLVAALASVDYDADNSIFELARAWDREPLCHSLIASLRSESEPRLREHSAWLLKHLAAPSSWKAIADLARSDEEPIQLRRWLLEALDRLAAGRAVGWRELGDVISVVSKHSDASLRDGVVGILVSLERSDEKRRLLLEILREDDDEVVLASAVNALASVLPMELEPELVDRLLSNPSPRVQRSVRDLIERAKKAQ